jgi:CRP-like cAMP-binding protein
MPEPFDPAVLDLDADSEILRLLVEFPDITPRRYRDGEYLVRQDEDSQEVFLVVKGAFLVERASEQPGAVPAVLATVLCDLDKPAIVGEMAYFGSQRRSASVRSSGSSFALCLKPALLDWIIRDYPGLTRAICAQFSWRLRETNRSLSELQARFTTGASPKVGQDGEILFSEGEPAETLFQLMSGAVRLDRGGQVEILGPEQLPEGFLDLRFYLRGGSHTATAKVEGSAFLVKVDAAHREAIVRGYPKLVLDLLKG